MRRLCWVHWAVAYRANDESGLVGLPGSEGEERLPPVYRRLYREGLAVLERDGDLVESRYRRRDLPTREPGPVDGAARGGVHRIVHQAIIAVPIVLAST